MQSHVMNVVLRSPGFGYLVSANPEGNHGRGQAWWSDCPTDAKRFPSVHDALRFWQQQSRTRPYRPDGGVNRPLTAYHVIVVHEEELSEANG